MKNKFLRGLSAVGLSILLVFTTLFTYPNDQSSFFRKKVSPVVYADDTTSAVWTNVKQHFYEFLAAGAVAGIVIGVQWTQQTIDQAIKLFQTKENFRNWASTTTLTEDDTKVKVVGDDGVLSNKFITESSKFWETFKTEFGTDVGKLTKVNVTDSPSWSGTYVTLTSDTFEDDGIAYAKTVYKASEPFRAVHIRTNVFQEIFFVFPYRKENIQFQTIRYKKSGEEYQNVSGTHTLANSGYGGYCCIGIGTLDTSMSVPQVDINTDEDSGLYKYAIQYTYGADAVAGALSAPSIDVYNNGNDKTQGYIDDASYGMLVPGIASGIDATNIASDGTVAGDIINTNIQQKVDDQAAAVPIDPAVPSTYPLSDTADVVKPVNPAIYNPPASITSESYGVLGLQDVFPFCIPYDLYDIVAAFVATPETPSFTWQTPWGTDVTIDLHQFDELAFWFRQALVVLFLIWLLQASRGSMTGD